MSAVTETAAVTAPVGVQPHPGPPTRPMSRLAAIGVAASASLLVGGAFATVWFWIPLAIMIVGISSIPSVIGFLLAAVVFIYLMRGVDYVERVRSEAVFGMGIGIPPRRLSHYT